MKVTETRVSGVGDRFAIEFDDGRRLTVLIRNDGERQVRWRPAADADSAGLFDVDERDARRIAEIFDGSYAEPVDAGLDDALENARVEWAEVDDDAPVAGRTIRESGIRTRRGVSVIAV